jgi:hypothetical protein
MPNIKTYLKACKRPINARAETVASSGMFRGAVASRRCLVPVDAFYEWRAMADGKQPYAIVRADGEPLAFAGLWEGWRDPLDQVFRTFTIITTAANAEMSRLHSRMPVVLEPDAWPVWLGGAATAWVMRGHCAPAAGGVNSAVGTGRCGRRLILVHQDGRQKMKEPHTETNVEHSEGEQNTGNNKKPGAEEAGKVDQQAGTRSRAENVEHVKP